MNPETPLDILSNALYNRGVEPEDCEDEAQQVLDELSRAGYVFVYSEREKMRHV